MVKETGVQEVSARLSEHPNFFVAAVNRLPAVEADAFRLKLFASRARLLMVKRKLGQRALEPLKISGLADLLEGSVGLVLSGDDPLSVARIIIEFRKTHEEQLIVRGAVIDGQLLDHARVEQLAQLPPKPILLAQVVATLESPIADVIFTLERLIGDIAWTLEQAAAAKPPEAQQAAAPAAQAAPETPATPTAPPAAPAGESAAPPTPPSEGQQPS